MDCRDFEDHLDVFEAGLLPPEEQAEASEHVLACSRCRTLLALVRGESDVLEPEVGDDLALAILRRTSGAVCLEAEERLCDCVDGTLGMDDQEIVSLHLAHCPKCSRLAETLVELGQALPEMATLDPDVQFTGDVLRATAGVRRIQPRSNLQAWWNQVMRRPRFAWEAAYVGTLLILLALGNPAMLPRASAVPQMLIERSDRLLHGTTSVLADQRVAAGRSLSGLRLKGKFLWDKAAVFQIQTTSALQREVASMLEQLKFDFFDGTPAEQPKNDLR
jgi:anti-sigma factor RsiW